MDRDPQSPATFVRESQDTAISKTEVGSSQSRPPDEPPLLAAGIDRRSLCDPSRSGQGRQPVRIERLAEQAYEELQRSPGEKPTMEEVGKWLLVLKARGVAPRDKK